MKLSYLAVTRLACEGGRILFIYLFLINLFQLFLPVLGLCCCVRAFSSCVKQGLLFVAVHALLIAVASLVVEHGLQAHGLQQLWHMGFGSCASWALECRLSSCGARAQLLRGMWDLPGPELEPVYPALAGGFLTTAPPGKPQDIIQSMTSDLSLLNSALGGIRKHAAEFTLLIHNESTSVDLQHEIK